MSKWLNLSKKQNNKEASFYDVLTSRNQGVSNFLVGKLKDTDKDKVPDMVDCNPTNPNEHGPGTKAPTRAQIIKAKLKKKPTKPTRVKPPTVAERRIIQKYGTLEAGEAARKSEQLKKEIESTVSKIEKGQITSIEQIPQAQRQYIDLPKEYFQKLEQQKVEQKQVDVYNKWIRKAQRTQKKYGFIPSTIPKELLGTKLGKEIEQTIKFSQELREKELRRIDVPEAPDVAKVEKARPVEAREAVPTGEVLVAPKRGFFQRLSSGVGGYLQELYPGTRSPITGIKEDVIPSIQRIPEEAKEFLLTEPVKKEISPVEIEIPEERARELGIEKPTKVELPSVSYLGEMEVRPVVSPQFGTIITDKSVRPWQRRDVLVKRPDADYARSIIRRVEEFIPGAGVALTTLQEQIYLPDEESTKKYLKLVQSKRPGAARDLTIFLRDQQAQLKRDIGRYNLLNAKMQTGEKLSNDQIKELNELYNKISKGQRGTGWQVVAEAGQKAQKEGKKVKIFGQTEISPTLARGLLAAGVKAYKMERDILLFEAGAGLLSGALATTATGARIAGWAGKVAKPLKYAAAPSAVGIGGFEAYKMYRETGDIPLALGAGVGATGGFLAAAYSKEIVESVGKGAKNIGKFIDKASFDKAFDISIKSKRGMVTASPKTKQKLKSLKKKGKKKATREEVKFFLENKISRKWNNVRQDFDVTVTYGGLSNAEKVEKANALIRLMKDKNNPEAWKQAIQVLRESYGDDFVKNWLIQEGIVQRKVVIDLVPKERLKTISKIRREQQLLKVPEQRLKIGRQVQEAIPLERRRIRQFFGPALAEAQKEELLISPMAAISTAMDTEQRQEMIVAPSIAQVTKQELKVDQFIGSKLAPEMAQKPEMALTAPPIAGIAPTYMEGPRRPKKPTKKPTKKPKVPSLFFEFEKEKPGVVKGQGYDAYALRKATKGRKAQYVKLNTKPLTQESALSMMGREVDKSISARGKIQKVKEVVQTIRDVSGKIVYKRVPQVNVIDTKDKYWRDNKNKFRAWKTKKKLPLPEGVVIERQKFRLDSPQEVRKIQAERRAAPPKLPRGKRRTFLGF